MAHRLPACLLAACCGAVSAGSVNFATGDSVDVPGRVVVGGKGAPNVVVWLDAPDLPRPPQTVVLDQRNLAFDPGVLVTSAGSTVVFPNNDRVLHNVFSFRDGKQFDLGLYPVGTNKRVTFEKPGVSRVFCNIHPGMVAYVVVVDSPSFALTNGNGEFVLRGVPVGARRYRAWRINGSEASRALVVEPGTTLEIQWPE
jgi:plastocyanin